MLSQFLAKLTTIFILCIGVAFAERSNIPLGRVNHSYPLIFASYQETPFIHTEVDNLRKLRDGGFTRADEVESIIQKWVSSCPADAFIIIDQPGLRVEDFQELPSIDKVPVWNQWRTFLGRAATVGSFPRLDRPLDTNWLQKVLKKQCGAVKVTANVRDTDPKDKSLPLEEYHDTRKRVVMAKFPRLPETQPERMVALQKHDEKLLEILQRTPTPFFSLVYTSSSGEKFNPEDKKYRKARFWDIFADIVRQKRDPRNRRDWQQHKSREAKPMATEAIDRKPPMAEMLRSKDVERRKPSAHPSEGSTRTGSQEQGNTQSNGLLTDDMLVNIVGINIACLGVFGAYKFLAQWI